MGKYGLAGQVTDDNKNPRLPFACYITKATITHSEFVIINWFSTATVVTRTRLIFTLYLVQG